MNLFLPPPTMNAHETSVGMIALCFPLSDFCIRLLVSHPCFDALENLLLRQARILQAADLPARKRWQALQMPVQQKLNCGVRKPDELQHNRFGAQGIEAVRASDIQDLRFRISRSREARRGIPTAK